MSMAFSKERFETPCGEGEQSCVLCRRFPQYCPIGRNENAFEMAERAELLKRLEDETISEDNKMLIKKALGINTSQPTRTKCGDCIHFANRDCPVGNGNTTADHICECVFFSHFANGSKKVSDNVNSPAHYNQGCVECIEALKAALGDKFIGFLVGNVLKYCWRYQHKNGLEDLRKAQYYLNRAIEEMSNEQPVP